ncbi:MAG: hypothetical protein ACR2P0_15785 [Acidimicrobiales bacterium]
MTPKPILTIVLLLGSLWAVPLVVELAQPGDPSRIAPAASAPARQAVAPTTVSGARQQEADSLFAWGRGQYAAEGLTLPEIQLVVLPSLSECNGRVGRYDERNNELRLCRIDDETMLHELAHAWIDHNMSDADRAAFVELRGVAEWNDRSLEWEERGAEQAAEILVWALSAHDRTVRWVIDGVESRRLLSIDNSSPTALRAGFELMVGAPPSRRMPTVPTSEVFSPEGRP